MIPAGILIPESILTTEFFAVFAAFVGINTVIYVALAIAKILPKVYFTDWITGSNRRAETRSIHPKSASHAMPRVGKLSVPRAPFSAAERLPGERRGNRKSPRRSDRNHSPLP